MRPQGPAGVRHGYLVADLAQRQWRREWVWILLFILLLLLLQELHCGHHFVRTAAGRRVLRRNVREAVCLCVLLFLCTLHLRLVFLGHSTICVRVAGMLLRL